MGISFMFLYFSPNYAPGIKEKYFYAKNLAGGSLQGYSLLESVKIFGEKIIQGSNTVKSGG